MKQIVLVLLLTAGLATLGHAQAVAPEAQKWEYLIATFDHPDTKQLNKLGAERWELVSVQPTFVNGHSESSGTYYFKRPLM